MANSKSKSSSAGKGVTRKGKSGASPGGGARKANTATTPLVRAAAPRIAVRRSGIHGKGVFAVSPIRDGQTIIEYTGERITEDEIERRYPEDMEGLNHTFVFGIRHDVNIDGGSGGNDSRWINHSCDPNCDTFEEDDRIFVRAASDIRPGEELTYDYAIEAGEPLTAAVKKRWPCWCGSKNCRGTVLVPTPRKRKRAAGTRRR